MVYGSVHLTQLPHGRGVFRNVPINPPAGGEMTGDSSTQFRKAVENIRVNYEFGG